MHWDQTKIIQSLEKFILENQMDELEWPHLEVFKAATRLDVMNMDKMVKLEESASEWVRIFKSLKAYIFLALKEREYSEAAIDILEMFTARFGKIREECLDESLEIMIKSLQFLYQPDIEVECKDNIQKYLEGLYFGRANSIDSEGEGLQRQKDFVYNAIKNFAELNQKSYQSSNLIGLMNEIVQDRRGEIFPADQATIVSSEKAESPNVSYMHGTGRKQNTLKKSIMAASFNINKNQ